MAIKSRPPGGGGRPRGEHFRYVGTDPGKTWTAYLAGPAVWLLCHTSQRTKPCLDDISNGELVCERCKNEREPLEIGYMPVYREIDWAPRTVILGAASRQKIEGLRLHTRVVVGREADDNDAVWATRAPVQTPVFVSTLTSRQTAADITPSLLRMWKIPELEEWLRATGQLGDATPKMGQPVALQPDGTPYSPMNQAAALRYGALNVPPDPSDQKYDTAQRHLGEKISRMQRPSKNGKHPAEQAGKGATGEGEDP